MAIVASLGALAWAGCSDDSTDSPAASGGQAGSEQAGSAGAAGSGQAGGDQAGQAGQAGSGQAGGGAGGQAGSGQAGGAGDETQSVTLRFAGQVGDEPFSCTQQYKDVGLAKGAWSPLDFRLYVHDLQLVAADGTSAPLTLDQDGVWQYQNLALLDFEDHTGTCSNGTDETNTKITGKVKKGSYSGLRFTIGVPPALNHLDAANQPSPLNLSSLWWGWAGGYKFLRADGSTGVQASFLVHLGATGCVNDPPATTCSNANLPTVTLPGFDPDQGTIVVDLAKLLAGVDVDKNTDQTAPGCMSDPDDPECKPIFASLGLDLATGKAAATTQTFIRSK
jgi:uncharacterized repeat protein (TIGR04052 family)